MDRWKIKLGLLLVAAGSIAYWAWAPSGPIWLIIACGVWAAVALCAFNWEKAEEWTYRLSSFLAVALGTVEGSLGLMNPHAKPWILAMAALHLIAFLLALAGRYQKAGGKRERRL